MPEQPGRSEQTDGWKIQHKVDLLKGLQEWPDPDDGERDPRNAERNRVFGRAVRDRQLHPGLHPDPQIQGDQAEAVLRDAIEYVPKVAGVPGSLWRVHEERHGWTWQEHQNVIVDVEIDQVWRGRLRDVFDIIIGWFVIKCLSAMDAIIYHDWVRSDSSAHHGELVRLCLHHQPQESLPELRAGVLEAGIQSLSDSL